MRKGIKVLLAAEEQLVLGHSLVEMIVARDNLRSAVPSCLLLELLNAKISQIRKLQSPQSPGAA
jgi:hypothetical protein